MTDTKDMVAPYRERILLVEPPHSPSKSSKSRTVDVQLDALAVHWKDKTNNNNNNNFFDNLVDKDSNTDSSTALKHHHDVRHLLSYNDRHPSIARVHMSVASHPSQYYPRSVLEELVNTDGNGNDATVSTTAATNSSPQGFLLQIDTTVKDNPLLDPQHEADAVEDVLLDLIRHRILTTPLAGGTWDVEDLPTGTTTPPAAATTGAEERRQQRNTSQRRRRYQMILPFEGAAWSSDALQQSFRAIALPPPNVCRSIHVGNEDGSITSVIKDDDNDDMVRFFGWSALEWSNFLVGGGTSDATTAVDDSSYIPTYKQMWWTMTREEEDSSISSSMAFGVRYKALLPSSSSSLSPSSSWKSWIPEAFLSKAPSPCPFELLGERQVFLVESTDQGERTLIPLSTDAAADTDISISSQSPKGKVSDMKYAVSIDQVLRRHHTNRGRFESWIAIDPTYFDDDASTTATKKNCQLTYRQVLPDFLSPTWRSLLIETNNEIVDALAKSPSASGIEATVEWNPDDLSSILYVTSTPQTELPSSLTISLEYEPAFLTLDDFPGDPNRGRELPPGRVMIHCIGTETSTHRPMVTTVYSNSLLLLPPVPDMSMPFNVISLTSSLYAYIVGTVVTILVRKASERIKYKLHPEKKPPSKLSQLKERLWAKLGFKTKTSTSGEAKCPEEGNALSTGGDDAKDSMQAAGGAEPTDQKEDAPSKKEE